MREKECRYHATPIECHATEIELHAYLPLPSIGGGGVNGRIENIIKRRLHFVLPNLEELDYGCMN